MAFGSGTLYRVYIYIYIYYHNTYSIEVYIEALNICDRVWLTLLNIMISFVDTEYWYYILADESMEG